MLATSTLSNYLWVLCIIKCTTSKFEVSLFPPLEGTGLLQELSLFNTGLGRSRSTTWLKWNSKPSNTQNSWHTIADILNIISHVLQITGENTLLAPFNHGNAYAKLQVAKVNLTCPQSSHKQYGRYIHKTRAFNTVMNTRTYSSAYFYTVKT